MSYATIDDMINRLGERATILASDRDNTGAINAACLEAAFSDASAEIDSYLSAKYSLPLPTIPGVVKNWCIDLARYLASSDAGSYTEEIRKRAEDVRDALKLLAAGKISLGLPPSQVPVSTAAPQVIAGRSDFKNFGGF